MLAFLGVFLIGIHSPRAQSNTEYDFRHQSTIVGDRFSADEDDAPQLTMNCLAANGYGQWTMSNTAGTGTTGVPTSTEYLQGWYLLANGLYKPSVKYVASNPSFPGCIPPGVVQSGNFTGVATPSEALVTANLNGTVDYVWPDRDASGTPFEISQFTTADLTNISFSFLTKPVPPMNLVTGAIHNPTLEIPTATSCPSPGSNHDVVTTTPYQDEFCVASDASYLYIVWCSSTNECTPGVPQIWATVVDLSTLTTVSGWPKELGPGTQPTVACDPRANRSSPTPTFEAAWLVVAPGAFIKRVSCVGTPGTPFNLTGSYINPNTGTTTSWTAVSHARIVVSSAPSATAVAAVYAIVTDEDATNALIFYQPATSTTVADYVDGAVMSSEPFPISGTGHVMDNFITAFANPYDAGDINNGGSGPDQFHCLYQFSPLAGGNPLLIVQGADNGEAHPSHLTDTRIVLNQWSGTIENDPTSYVGAVNQMGIHVHWLSDSASVVVHNYSRDMNRTFNENIEENTLVTDQCTVSGGGPVELLDNTRMAIWTDPNYGADLSDHTGDIGLWQPGTLYHVDGILDPHVGTLNFTGDNTVLQIGGLTSSDGGSYLTDMPYFYCNFDFESTGQGITFGPFSTFDYYGLIANHNSDGSIEFSAPTVPYIGSPFVANGATDQFDGAGIITLFGYSYINDALQVTYEPATLNIHGGADFGIGDGGQLQSGYVGNIQVLYDGNVYPLPPATPRCVTGHATLHGTTYIEESAVEGYIPADSFATIISLRGYDAIPQFLSGSTNYSNSSEHGVSEIQIQPELKPVNAVEFDTDAFAAVRIHDIDPESSGPFDVGSPGELTVDNSTFEHQHGRSIFVEDNEDPTDGDAAVITITNNTFGIIDTHDRNTDPDAAAFGTYGIYIKGLDANYNGLTPSLVGTVMVEDNLFTTNNWSRVNPCYPTVPNLEYAAAICFENTTGNIIGNRILDPAYTRGIWLLSTAYDDVNPTSNTLICSNTIQQLHLPDKSWLTTSGLTKLIGIEADFHTGYVQLNSITDCDFGYLASGASTLDPSTLIYNTIDNTFDPSVSATYWLSNAIGVTGVSSSYFLDLAGSHKFGDDFGGFNSVFATPGTENNADITMDANSFVNLGDMSGGTWTQFGQNNLEMFTGLSSSTSQPTSGDAYILQGVGISASALGNLDFNFWNTSVDPHNGTGTSIPQNWIASSSVVNATNITYTLAATSNTLGGATTFSGIACGSSYEARTKKDKSPKPQSIEFDSSDSPCQMMAYNISQFSEQGQWTMAYDSTQYFVAHCYTNSFATNAIGSANTDVQNGAIGSSPGCWEQNLQWLLSLLPVRHDAQWLCTIVQAVAGSLMNGVDTSYQQINTGTNRTLSVIHWILQNPLCANSVDSELYVNSRGSQIRTWLDTQDTDSVKLDTTIYTMQQLGLDSVLLYAGLLSVSNNTPSIITNATAYPNPAGEGTVISFGITREAYVSVNLFNVLGHQVENAGFGGVVEPGNLSVPMSLQGLPSGTYFARIVTTFGEVQSVKIVKE